MKKSITVLTVVFLLFTISAAFRPLSITPIHDHDDVSNDAVLTTELSSEEGSPNDVDDVQISSSKEAVIRDSDESTSQTLIITPRLPNSNRLSRSNQINRHFYNDARIPLRFVRRHPCRNYFHIHNHIENNKKLSLPAVESVKTIPSGNVIVSTREDHGPSDWLEFKHEYGHRHHHHHHHESEIDGDKLQMHHHHHQHKGIGFMRAIRKFLKHTFD